MLQALEPFPVLLDDLLDAWFGSEGAEGDRNGPALQASELVHWARCGRFRRRWLRAHLEELTPRAFASFSRAVSLEQEEISGMLRQQLQADLKALSQAPVLRTGSSPVWFMDGALMRRFWKFGMLDPRQLGGALVRVLLRPWFLPVRLGLLGLDLLQGAVYPRSPCTGPARQRLAVEWHCIGEALGAVWAFIAAVT